MSASTLGGATTIVVRAAINVPASAIVFVLGMPFAWAAADANSAILKAIVVGPFITAVATPMFLILHLLAAVAGALAERLRMPGRVVSMAVAGLLAWGLAGGSPDREFGDPAIQRIVLTAALALPWAVIPLIPWLRGRAG